VVLSGGSAFGLAAADGVCRALADLGRGFPTVAGPVPIVPAAALYDLVESGGVAPGPSEDARAGRRAWPNRRSPKCAARWCRSRPRWEVAGIEYGLAGGLGWPRAPRERWPSVRSRQSTRW